MRITKWALPNAGLVDIPRPSPQTVDAFSFRLSEDSRCFDGHFDGQPVFPGVGHLALATMASERLTGSARMLVGIRDVRFRHPLMPNDDITVNLRVGPSASSVRFEILCRGACASSGLLIYSDCDVPAE